MGWISNAQQQRDHNGQRDICAAEGKPCTAMDRHDFHTLDDARIQDIVREWLTTSIPSDDPDSTVLGEWLVTTGWHNYPPSPAELVFETVCLAIGAASDRYDGYEWDPDDVCLFNFDYRDGFGDTDHVYWLDSHIDRGWITFVAFWTDQDGDDADAYLPTIQPDTASLDAALGTDNVAAVQALTEQVVRVLQHLRAHLDQVTVEWPKTAKAGDR